MARIKRDYPAARAYFVKLRGYWDAGRGRDRARAAQKPGWTVGLFHEALEKPTGVAPVGEDTVRLWANRGPREGRPLPSPDNHAQIARVFLGGSRDQEHEDFDAAWKAAIAERDGGAAAPKSAVVREETERARSWRAAPSATESEIASLTTELHRGGNDSAELYLYGYPVFGTFRDEHAGYEIEIGAVRPLLEIKSDSHEVVPHSRLGEREPHPHFARTAVGMEVRGPKGKGGVLRDNAVAADDGYLAKLREKAVAEGNVVKRTVTTRILARRVDLKVMVGRLSGGGGTGKAKPERDEVLDALIFKIVSRVEAGERRVTLASHTVIDQPMADDGRADDEGGA